MKTLLTDVFYVKMSLEEDSKTGKVIASGEFGRCDVPTQNNRVYGRKIYEREIAKLQESVVKRRAYGELDHPLDGKTKLNRVSHIMTDLRIEDDGRVIGKAEILDTPSGRTLKAILSAGGEVGVSSRGFGSTRQGSDGNTIVGEDFVLKTFDFVADPAMKTAYPKIIKEDIDIEMMMSEFPEVSDDLIEGIRTEESKKIRAELSVELQEAFDSKLAEAIEESKPAKVEATSEEVDLLGKIADLVHLYKSDPDSVAVRDALESKDEEIGTLKGQNSKLQYLAKSAAFQLVMEKKISGHNLKEMIRTSIGDVSKFDTRVELEGRIDSIMEELSEYTENVKDDETVITEDVGVNSELNEELDSLQESNEQLESKVTKKEKIITGLKGKLASLRENHRSELRDMEKQYEGLLDESENIVSLKEYKIKSVKMYVNPSELNDLLESADDEDEVDEIVEEYGRTKARKSKYNSLREELKSQTRGFRGKTKINEEAEDLEENEQEHMVTGDSGYKIDLDETMRLTGL